MDDTQNYAVFFYDKSLETLGDAIKPYLHEGPAGVHLRCRELDAGGSLTQLTLDALTTSGEPVDLQLMVPTSMVRMVISARNEEAFGFGPRQPVPATRLPPVSEEVPKSG